jgi:glucosylglycerate synthase
MSRLEAEQEIRQHDSRTGDADLLIGIIAPVAEEHLHSCGREAVRGLIASMPSLRCAVAYPGVQIESAQESVQASVGDPQWRSLPYPPSAEPSLFPWIGRASAYKALDAIATELRAKACVVIGPDLAAMNAASIHALAQGVFENQCDLIVPLYSLGKFEALLNNSILAPLTRALYGRRIRFPMTPDYGLSARMLNRLANPPGNNAAATSSAMRWPTVEAVVAEQNICQAYLGTRHESQNEGMDLSSVLGGLLGSLFSEMERNAAIWQRVRGSQAVPLQGGQGQAPAPSQDAIDVRPLLESFQLGARNLQEVWSLVLPPVTLVELKHLSVRSADRFRIPDDLWVRIVYDFALAHRLRNISRVHILGALTPLYLGWVASHVMAIANESTEQVDQRLESLARAYEEGKPYLLSRWRWPDRFNP